MNIQKYVLEQFAKTLPHDQAARRTFVQTGGLQLVQQLNEQFGGRLSEHISTINRWARGRWRQEGLWRAGVLWVRGRGFGSQRERAFSA